MASVLITGCSSGFGQLAALTFAGNGHRVFASMRNLDKAGPLRDAAAGAGLSVELVQLDVLDNASVEAAVAHVVEAAGSLDIVVNNAGIELLGPIHLTSDDEIARIMDTNVSGVLRVVRAAVPHMLAAGGGAIVNVGSLAGRVAPPYGGVYAASKHAVEALSEGLHFELSQQGIRVHVIEPGQFATALGANAAYTVAMVDGSPEHQRFGRYREAQRRLVNGEPADPQLVADAIYRAATEESPKLRHPVGADAEMVIAVKDQLSFEDFDAAMRSTLDWHE